MEDLQVAVSTFVVGFIVGIFVFAIFYVSKLFKGSKSDSGATEPAFDKTAASKENQRNGQVRRW